MRALKIFFAVLLMVLVSCRDNEEPQSQQMGCASGILIGTSTRVNFRCCTKAEFDAGSNTSIGGTAAWTNYSDHQWTSVSDCGECD